MGGFYGIDCAADGRWTVLPQATQTWGKPRFIGRYQGAAWSAATADELAAYQQDGLAVPMLWNGDQDGTFTAGTYGDGYHQGVLAVNAWKALGAKNHQAVFWDVETRFFLSPTAAQGFMNAVHDSGMVPGFYLNPRGGNNHAAAYAQARKLTRAPQVVVFTSENELPANAEVAIHDFVTNQDTGAQFVEGFEADTILWQTSEALSWVDLDCCREDALRYFLYGQEPITTLAVNAALKHMPNHIGPAVADLKAGCVLDFTGHVTPHWAEVKVVHGTTQKLKDAAGLEGWLLRADLSTVWEG